MATRQLAPLLIKPPSRLATPLPRLLPPFLPPSSSSSAIASTPCNCFKSHPPYDPSPECSNRGEKEDRELSGVTDSPASLTFISLCFYNEGLHPLTLAASSVDYFSLFFFLICVGVAGSDLLPEISFSLEFRGGRGFSDLYLCTRVYMWIDKFA